jgi:serine/threonine protein phosphatase PrpC
VEPAVTLAGDAGPVGPAEDAGPAAPVEAAEPAAPVEAAGPAGPAEAAAPAAVSGVRVGTCPECGAVTTSDAVFCENCGAQIAPVGSTDGSAAPATEGEETPITLSTRTLMTESNVASHVQSDVVGPEPRCPQCGGAYAPDGYCETCGAPRANERDHFTEQPAAWVAGVCDRGLRHATNEDALALSAEADPSGRVVLVVCDGVSNTLSSDVASLAAARAARDLLAGRRAQGLGTPGSRSALVADALRVAAEASRKEVVRLSTGSEENPPSCTFVAAVVEDGHLAAGSIGDSRAYWLPDEGQPQAVTVDDSLAAEQIAAGVPRAEAEGGPHAHAITRWLGVDAPEGPPRIAGLALDAPGWVLLCSDGLWNYCSEAGDLAALVRRLADGDRDPLALADSLVGYANEQGGQDNISVAVCRVQPAAAAPAARA